MSYTPTNWQSGDVVTSAKLNKIEQGIAAGCGILIAHMINDEGNYILDKTWQEIYDADICYIISRDDEQSNREFVERTDFDNNKYYIFSGGNNYIADSPNGTLTWNLPT